MSKDYSEDQLIQKSAADLLENELGWTRMPFDKGTRDCKSNQTGIF